MRLLVVQSVCYLSSSFLIKSSPHRTRRSIQLPSTLFYAANEPPTNTTILEIRTENNTVANSSSLLTLQQQAAALRQQASKMEAQLRDEQERIQRKKVDNVDRWIRECLLHETSTAEVEWLHSVDTVVQRLQDGRFSHEQVQQMFDRISESTNSNTRSDCSPLLGLLVDAAGRMDGLTADQRNENKRWSGKVERDLRKQLFARDWGMEVEPEVYAKDSTRFL